ncbi:hypothetical protein AYM40_23145 [Paraburkholderia phytofirmans OLGA172]|uniref:Uncharacterized protein n=1 Tax=Paraburkholderia phytofirmans OLGA172 TaxID=1417228 RepID=A0A160FQR5_9BURK|nr:hypothetical protein AYM40_23145 [Paraburkholderia phytofirmans OLGA172]
MSSSGGVDVDQVGNDPWQQFVNDWILSDTSDDVAQVAFEVEAVPLGCLCGALTTRCGSRGDSLRAQLRLR